MIQPSERQPGLDADGCGTVFSKDQCPTTPNEIGDMEDIPYRELLGGLMYLATHTRPDIAFAVNTLTQFMQNPGCAH